MVRERLQAISYELVDLRIVAIQAGAGMEIEQGLSLIIDELRDLMDEIAQTPDLMYALPVRRVRHPNRVGAGNEDTA